MYLKMLVGAYLGEIRGPFDVLTGRHLIASNQAIKAEFDPESGEFRVPGGLETAGVDVTSSADAGGSAQRVEPLHKKARR